jgi:hypothetical protein
VPRGGPALEAALLTLVMLPCPYLVLGVGQALLGRSGLPLSPLIAAFVVAAVWALSMYRERQLKGRDPRWKEHNDGWVRYLQLLAVVTILGPIVVGALWPLSVLSNLRPAEAAGLLALPTVALIVVMVFNRYRFLRSNGGEGCDLRKP